VQCAVHAFTRYHTTTTTTTPKHSHYIRMVRIDSISGSDRFYRFRIGSIGVKSILSVYGSIIDFGSVLFVSDRSYRCRIGSMGGSERFYRWFGSILSISEQFYRFRSDSIVSDRFYWFRIDPIGVGSILQYRCRTDSIGFGFGLIRRPPTISSRQIDESISISSRQPILRVDTPIVVRVVSPLSALRFMRY
jgi:hypothetical protein